MVIDQWCSWLLLLVEEKLGLGGGELSRLYFTSHWYGFRSWDY